MAALPRLHCRWDVIAVSALMVCVSLDAHAADLRDENSVRAAFVFNLTRYVEWPGNLTNLRICFLGDDGAGSFLKATLQGKVSEKRTIEVSLDGEQALDHCQVMYVDYHSPERTRDAILRARGHRILTVGVAESFAANGGMIGLVTQSDHVRLQVNLRATQEAQLKVSSRVLALATIVNPPAGGR